MSCKATNTNWRVVTAILAASTLLFSAISSTTLAAFAESSANLKALPKQSLVDDGNSQLLRLKFKLEIGSIFQYVVVIIDAGTPNEKTVFFDAQGNILSGDPAFEFVIGRVTMLSDGYYAIVKAKGKFVIGMNKLLLGEGEHTAEARVVLGAGQDPLIATDTFILKSSVPLLPDLVAEVFIAPSTMNKGQRYWTLTIETNEGDARANQHHAAVYLSENNALDSGDELLGERGLAPLRAGDFHLIPLHIKAPENTDDGTHYLFVKVDSRDRLEELSEDNNVLSKQTDIMPSDTAGLESDEEEDEDHDDSDGDDNKNKNGKEKDD